MTGEILSVEFFVRTCLWQSIALAAVGLAASFLLRHRSSRAHQVLLLSIIAAVIVPIVSALVKQYELGVFVAEPAAVQPHLETEAVVSDFSPAVPIGPDVGYEPGLIEGDSPPAMTGSQSASLPWAHIALCGWVAASLILAARLLVTFALGVRLLGRAARLDCVEMHKAVRIAGAKLGIAKNVEIRNSRDVRSPVIWCWRCSPVLLVPAAIGRFDNRIDWAGVLCHELAHWKRRDHISGLLAELAVCVLPWHPLLWWAKYRLTSLSEQACDDWVLATGQPGTNYAECLLDLTPGGQMAFVPAVVSSKRGLAGRVHRILKDSCGNPRLGTKWILSAGIVTICIAMTVAFAQTRPANTNNIEDEAPLNTLKIDTLPDGWTLDYDNGLMPNGGRSWRANMAENLLELKAIPTPANEYDESWKEERLELHIRSQQGEQISTISIKDDRTGNRIILAPGQYSLLYTRAKKDPDTSLFVQIESVEFPFVLSRPGMYELKFRPKLETSEAVESGTYPSAICTGTVIDSEGNLVNEADVAAYEMFFDRAGNINLRFVSEAITKSDGKLAFEITPSVQKNRSRGGIVVARKEGLAIGWAHWSLYGNQEIKITLQEPTRLSGEVIDENNKSIPNAEVRAVLFEKKSSQEDETRWLPGIKPLDWISVRTDRNGRFEFNNMPENVRSGLLVSAPGLGTIYSCKPDGQGGYESIMFETGTTDIKITVSAEAIIEGKLIDEKTGAGIAGETLAVVPHFIPVFFERYLCTTQNDGTFNIGALRSGKYVIRRVGQNSTRIDILAESGKTISDVIIKCPRDIQNTEAVSDIVFPNRNHLPAVARPGSPETKAVQPEYIPGYHQLPDSWSLDYESSFSPDKIKNISTNIGGNLASLEVLPRPTDITDDSWKNEKFEFRIRSLDGARIGDISVRPKSEFSEMEHKIFQPGKYLLSYERGYRKPGYNYRMKSGTFLLDMSLPGMYELHFAPKLGNAEISGLAGGCYAVNFERTGSGIPTRGFAYINREKEYRLDGLSPGTYRLSAVAQQQTGNVIVSQAQVTIENETKVTVDIAPPPKGNCSLKGSILGRQKTYTFNTPGSYQSQGRWFVLIRKLGSGIIKTTNAYEAQTMDSLYAVRGRNIVQDTKDKASYTIEGIVPGEYTVTAMENPWYSGSAITRQQSKRVTIRPAENVLDFDLRITPPHNPGPKADKEDSDKASGEDMKKVAELTENFDKKEDKVEREYETVRLKYTGSSKVAKRLKEAIQQMADTELQQNVLIQPLVNAKQIVIFGRKDLREMVRKLIAEIDVPLDQEQVKPRILTLNNSDPIRMAGLLTKLFAGEDEDRVNIYEVLFGKASEEKRKTFGLASRQLTFEAVPGTKKVIVISNFGEAYDVVGKLILELDKQKMAAKDVKQVREWIARLVSEGKLRGSNISGAGVTGLVKDPQGRPVSGTRVTLFQTKLEYVTDAEGKFTAFLPSSDKMRYFFAVDKLRELVGVGRLAGGKQQVEISLAPARIVSGRVVGPDGRPVSGAQIAPLPMTCFHVLTDSKGRFDVGWSSEWAGNIKDFCLMARHVELNLAAVVDVTPETQTVDVKLEPALSLRGTVEDDNGRPIPGAVAGLSLIRGWGAGTPVRNAITDDQGRFELPALPQRQEYGVRANAEGYQRNTIKTGMINRVTEWEQVGPVILKKPVLSASGIVVDDSGKPVANIPVYWRGEGQPRLASKTDTQGRFRFDEVCAGPVQINAKNETLFGTVETQGGAKDVRLVVGPRFAPQPDDPPR